MNIHQTSIARKLALSLLILIASTVTAAAQDFKRYEFFVGYSRGWMKSNINSITFTTPDGGGQTFSDLCSAQTGEMLGQNSQKLFCDRRGFNGADLSVAYHFTRYFGIKADFTTHSKSDSFVDDFGGAVQTIKTDEKLYTLLGGVQLKDNSAGPQRWRPFAHALAGMARYTNRQSQDIDVAPEFNFSANDRETSLALKIGGGLDMRVSPHVDLRLIEVDYVPVFAGDRKMKTLSGPFDFRNEGQTAQDFTAAIGIVLH